MLESMTICKLKRLRFVQTVSIANSSYSEHIRSRVSHYYIRAQLLRFVRSLRIMTVRMLD